MSCFAQPLLTCTEASLMPRWTAASLCCLSLYRYTFNDNANLVNSTYINLRRERGEFLVLQPPTSQASCLSASQTECVSGGACVVFQSSRLLSSDHYDLSSDCNDTLLV